MFHAFLLRCRVLHKSPPLRGDLMKLRVKDLQHFLSKRQINIKACVGKFLPPSPILFDLGSLVVLRSTSVVRFVPHLLTVVHQETLPPSQGATNRISKNCQGPFNHWQWNGNLLPFIPKVERKLYSFLILMTVFVTTLEAVELPIGSCLISGGLAVSWFCYGTFPKQLFIGKFGIQSDSQLRPLA